MDREHKEKLLSANLTLNNGVVMPKVGLGKIPKSTLLEPVLDGALGTGYRLFDIGAETNIEAVGNTFRKFMPKYCLGRDDIFISIKLAPTDLGHYQMVSDAYQRAIDSFGVPYADMCVLDFQKNVGISLQDDVRNYNLRRTAWEALSQVYREGRVKAIGLANCDVRLLENLHIKADGIMPAVNQVEWLPHVYLDLPAYCQRMGICLHAFGLFGSTNVLCIWEDLQDGAEMDEFNTLRIMYTTTPGLVSKKEELLDQDSDNDL